MAEFDRARFRRNKKLQFERTRVALAARVPAGTLVEFQYGAKKDFGKVGGWHGDPRPILLVLYDDQRKYIEGLNTNYLPETLLKELLQVVRQVPDIGAQIEGGTRLYNMIKSVKPDVLVAYRKYFRKKLLTLWKMEVDLTKLKV